MSPWPMANCIFWDEENNYDSMHRKPDTFSDVSEGGATTYLQIQAGLAMSDNCLFQKDYPFSEVKLKN